MLGKRVLCQRPPNTHTTHSLRIPGWLSLHRKDSVSWIADWGWKVLGQGCATGWTQRVMRDKKQSNNTGLQEPALPGSSQVLKK